MVTSPVTVAPPIMEVSPVMVTSPVTAVSPAMLAPPAMVTAPAMSTSLDRCRSPVALMLPRTSRSPSTRRSDFATTVSEKSAAPDTSKRPWTSHPATMATGPENRAAADTVSADVNETLPLKLAAPVMLSPLESKVSSSALMLVLVLDLVVVVTGPPPPTTFESVVVYLTLTNRFLMLTMSFTYSLLLKASSEGVMTMKLLQPVFRAPVPFARMMFSEPESYTSPPMTMEPSPTSLLSLPMAMLLRLRTSSLPPTAILLLHEREKRPFEKPTNMLSEPSTP